MTTFDPDDQALLREALAAALASDEIRAGMRLTGATEARLRENVWESEDEIWQAVAQERRRHRDVLNRMSAAEDRRRSAPYPVPGPEASELHALWMEYREGRSRLGKAADDLLTQAASDVEAFHLQKARDAVVGLDQLVRGWPRESEWPPELREVIRKALRYLDIALLVLRDANEQSRRPEPDQWVDAITHANDMLEQLLNVFPKSEPEFLQLMEVRHQSRVTDLEIPELRAQVAKPASVRPAHCSFP
jgi:hypothetical protein